MRTTRLLLACLLLCASRVHAQAKVAFTGYADVLTTPHGRFRIEGNPNVLSNLRTGSGPLEARGFTLDSVGLFATTSLSDQTRLLVDFTYRDIGNNVRTTRLQYAFLEHESQAGTGQIGKIKLPFGYYNERRFYPFQRPSVGAPLFQSSILGLPISDIGARAWRTVDLGAVNLRADLYAVNGFGPVSGSSYSFRSAGVPGGLTIANNVSGASSNHRPALGGRLELAGQGKDSPSAGLSYYRKEWHPQGIGLFEMGGAHAHAKAGKFDLLAEYLLLKTSNDGGMEQNFGSRHWRTDGFFAQTHYDALSVAGKPVIPWARYENYQSRGGAPGLEALWATAGGVAVRALDNVTVKLEAMDFHYKLPYQGLEDLTLIGYLFRAGLTVTF